MLDLYEEPLTRNLFGLLQSTRMVAMEMDPTDTGRVISQGTAFGDLEDDIEIKADKVLGEHLAGRIQQMPDVGTITIEGFDDIHVGNGPLRFCVDPLDGSLNYVLRGLTMGLPYSACVTVLDRQENATFADIIAAGVIDLRSGDHWLAHRASPDGYRTVNNHREAVAMPVTNLDIGSQILYGEFYYSENRKLLAEMFDEEDGWLRNPGSAAYEMASVSSGQAVAFICRTQKQHELGAAYALVKGAGGVAWDFEGRDLGPRPFTFNEKTPVILAANEHIADQLLERLQR